MKHIRWIGTKAEYDTLNIDNPRIVYVEDTDEVIWNKEVINFPDPILKAGLVARYDTNNDGEIDTDEALRVTSFPQEMFKNTEVTSIEGLEYFKNVSVLPYEMFAMCRQIKVLRVKPTLPVGYMSFYILSGLNTLIIEDGVTEIGYNEFARMGEYGFYEELGWGENDPTSGVDTLIIPDSVTTIGDYAFDCWVNSTSYGPKELRIGRGISKIGQYTFAGFRMTEVTIPSNVTRIDANAFWASKLRTVIMESSIPPSIQGDWSNMVNTVVNDEEYDFRIFVPDAAVDVYKGATNWIRSANKIFPMSQYNG